VDSVGFWETLFDFNHDGEIDFCEKLLVFSMAASVADAVEEEERFLRELEEEEAEEEEDAQMERTIRTALSEIINFDVSDYEDARDAVIRAKLTDLERKLFDWECEEPDDILSASYDAWEEGREQLEYVISDLKDLLDE
jgi:hypothetical protein